MRCVVYSNQGVNAPLQDVDKVQAVEASSLCFGFLLAYF